MPTSSNLEVVKPLQIPWIYRLWNCYLEPLSCVFAIVIPIIDRAGFLSVFIPSTAFRADFGLDSNSAIASNNIDNPIVSLLLYETFCLYAVFIVMEVGLMRWASTTTMLNAVPEARMVIARWIMLANLASDIFYLTANWMVYSSDTAARFDGITLFFSPWLWGRNEWINLGMTWMPLVQRVCFLAGIGLDDNITPTKVRSE